MHPYHKRLAKEYQSIIKEKLPGIDLVPSSDKLRHFLFKIHVDNHKLYPEGYFLQITITDNYPVDSSSVKFIVYDDVDECSFSPIPIYPRIYSNGHICLNLLGEDWTFVCPIQSILLSIQSMLHANTLAGWPPDDIQYTKSAPNDPKSTNFVYHDDTV